MNSLRVKNQKWTNEELALEALDYKTRGEFQKNSNSAYQTARKKGLMAQICAHMPKHVSMVGENNPAFKWTLEYLKKEAFKYNSRNEFREKNVNAYSRAKAKKILDQICSHMEPSLTEAYSYGELQEEALKYDTRMEFQKNSRAYTVASKRGVLDQICSHMKMSCGSSRQEKELMKNIKIFYPNATGFRDLKVKIVGKSHIKGFYLDIYVPELRRAIEFDGTYYHSFKVMRASKGRSKWPDDDVRNYHDLKDTWFWTSKGIKILHIKEEDWNVDKQACIQRCLDFLGGVS